MLHVSRRRPRLLYFLSYTFSVLAHSHRQCADLPVKFHWGSPHFFTSLLSPSSHTPLFISFFPSSSTEGREDWFLTYLRLPLNDGQLGDEDYFLRVTKKTILGRPWPWPFWDKRRERKRSAAPWMKLETSWCCLRMFWSGGGMSTPATLAVCSLPLPRSLSSFTWPLADPTASIFEIRDTFPFLIFSLSLSGRVCLFKLHGDSPS